MEPNKTIWIVGGSSGIGLELVKLCLKNNYNIVVSSRNSLKTKELLDLKNTLPEQIHILDLDVTNKKDIKEKVKEAWSCFDGIDIWFYNAGSYDVMNIDSWDSEKFEQMNEVNYLGVTRLMTELIPYFKNSNKGHWVWNSSLSSYFGLPHAGAYSAPKAALVNLAQSIQPELNSLNIKLQIINHGFVKTKLTDKNKFKMPQLMEASFTAAKILKGIENSTSFEIRFPFILSLVLRIINLLPYSLSLALTKRSM
ncbi:SDR family NAD(P)-dependent oxidoreductase [Poseidonibacter antarcticus]|uniref:SDR family NAD(P)-dependent oxidoreductase n=1 Tax=Poseidonibacter antarcticus TaxID=2478538 RepID=UPI000EF46DE9|nr:SDR family NAD(P)-dependent oxidoreductase [Poseidonibacter antarcticus]